MREQIEGSMASLTLAFSGYERSVISHHFPSWYLLGIAPNLLMYTSVKTEEGKGPNMLPAATSLVR